MSKKDTVIDVRDLIEEKLKQNERSLAWLSRQTGISYSTIYSNFGHRLYQVSKENLDKINEVLGTDFTLSE